MIDLQQVLIGAIMNAISGILSNIVWIILIIWGVRKISKIIITKVPEWLSSYHEKQMKELAVKRAILRYDNK